MWTVSSTRNSSLKSYITEERERETERERQREREKKKVCCSCFDILGEDRGGASNEKRALLSAVIVHTPLRFYRHGVLMTLRL